MHKPPQPPCRASVTSFHPLHARRRSLPVTLAVGLACCACLAQLRALEPPPDGGYPNQTTAEGDGALSSLTSGSSDTAVGFFALFSTTSGKSNTGTGDYVMSNNTTGSFNTACGAEALSNNVDADNNTGVGYHALYLNHVGDNNVAIGREALWRNTGSSNIALGSLAGANLTNGNNNIHIGALGKEGESNTIRIGKGGTQTSAFIQGIYNSPVANGVPVIVNPGGKLGVATSSARFKEEIKPMENASEKLLALKPVTFRYKDEIDPDSIPQFGLVAEEVEKVSPELVARDDHGKAFTVRYEAVNAMLLNEFLKEHRQAQAEREKVANLEASLAQQSQQIEALTNALQKVSDRVELRAAHRQFASGVR